MDTYLEVAFRPENTEVMIAAQKRLATKTFTK